MRERERVREMNWTKPAHYPQSIHWLLSDIFPSVLFQWLIKIIFSWSDDWPHMVFVRYFYRHNTWSMNFKFWILAGFETRSKLFLVGLENLFLTRLIRFIQFWILWNLEIFRNIWYEQKRSDPVSLP